MSGRVDFDDDDVWVDFDVFFHVDDDVFRHLRTEVTDEKELVSGG